MRRWIAAVWLFAVVLICGQARALDNGLAATPPMGWNSWNRFACNVNETVIRATADAIVSSGMRDAGYRYVIVDDCWQGPRNSAGVITADQQRFPSGIKALADYVHSRGLKFGIYSDAGDYTCQHRSGSHGYETQDAATYAAWGVDYVKYDWCFTRGLSQEDAYKTMSDALAATGRPMVFSICEWGLSQPWDWAPDVGNLWRTTGDIADCFNCDGGKPPPPRAASDDHKGPPPPMMGVMGLGVLQVLDLQAGLGFAAGPGHWNDPDMLEVGNGGMNDTEDQAHFSLWAMLAAPLVAGNDIAHMSDVTKTILTNPEVIAIDQDKAGSEGRRVAHSADSDIWVRDLADGSRAVALLNRTRQPEAIAVNWHAVGFAGPVHVRDLWAHQDLGQFDQSYQVQVPPHGVVLLKAVAQ